MNPSSLIVGQTYYRITFADVVETMPGVEPMIFVGIDVFGPQTGGGESKYYFQDTPSFSSFGLAASGSIGTPIHGDGMPRESYSPEDRENPKGFYLSGHTAEEIGWVILDLSGVVEAVKGAAERAEKLGYPLLKVARG